jgi:hypothetical protein
MVFVEGRDKKTTATLGASSLAAATFGFAGSHF